MKREAIEQENAGTPADPPEKPNQLVVRLKVGETIEAGTARLVLDPVVRGAITAEGYRPNGLDPVPIGRMIDELAEHCAQIQSGAMSRPEAMLAAQAQALDAIFSRLATHAAHFVGHNADTVDRYLRLALKAQGQCRTTLEALANLKSPPIVYAKQANIAHGHQQVNNNLTAATSRQASPSEIPQNELLGAPND